METQFSVHHNTTKFQGIPTDVTHLQLRVETPLGPVIMTCGIAWDLPPDPSLAKNAIKDLMGYAADPDRNFCYRYVVSLPNPTTLGLQLATLEYFGQPRKSIDRGFQVDLLVNGRRKATSKVARRITDRSNLQPLENHLLATAQNAYGLV